MGKDNTCYIPHYKEVWTPPQDLVQDRTPSRSGGKYFQLICVFHFLLWGNSLLIPAVCRYCCFPSLVFAIQLPHILWGQGTRTFFLSLSHKKYTCNKSHKYYQHILFQILAVARESVWIIQIYQYCEFQIPQQNAND